MNKFGKFGKQLNTTQIKYFQNGDTSGNRRHLYFLNGKALLFTKQKLK
jgi:hypothetical protein